MTKKPRFSGLLAPQREEGDKFATPLDPLAPLDSPAFTTPAAPVREERRPFSTRVRPSRKAALDAYVMQLKRAGWPVTQELVLEELLRLLEEDSGVQHAVTAALTRRS